MADTTAVRNQFDARHVGNRLNLYFVPPGPSALGPLATPSSSPGSPRLSCQEQKRQEEDQRGPTSWSHIFLTYVCLLVLACNYQGRTEHTKLLPPADQAERGRNKTDEGLAAMHGYNHEWRLWRQRRDIVRQQTEGCIRPVLFHTASRPAAKFRCQKRSWTLQQNLK